MKSNHGIKLVVSVSQDGLRRIGWGEFEITCFVAFQEIEAALEAEESKVTRAQLELTQYKQEAEKRIADKDEELENLRLIFPGFVFVLF